LISDARLTLGASHASTIHSHPRPLSITLLFSSQLAITFQRTRHALLHDRQTISFIFRTMEEQQDDHQQQAQNQQHQELIGQQQEQQLQQVQQEEVESDEDEEVEDDDPLVMSGALFSACYDGNFDTTVRLLDAGQSVNCVSEDDWDPAMVVYFEGWNPVMVALWSGHLSIAIMLVGRGADLSRVDIAGSNVLHLAAVAGRDCIEWVLANTSIDVNSTNNDGFNPILYACPDRVNRVDSSKLLVEKGANLFMKNDDGKSVMDLSVGPQLLQHAKDLIWVSVKPLLLLTKSISIAADDDSLPSPVLLSVDKAFGISGIVRRIASFLKVKGLIVRDPSIPKEEQEPDDVKRRVEAALAAGSSSSSSSSKRSRH
jgi:hypothetical protein